MAQEKKNILIQRVVFTLLLAICIIVALAMTFSSPKPAKIVDQNGYVDYYDSLNDSTCEIEIICAEDVQGSNITVAFYDEEGNLLSTETEYFYPNSNKLTETFYYINGKVDSYEIVDGNINAYDNSDVVARVFFIMSPFILILLICSLMLSYKVYDYDGNKIEVYSGWYYHYIKINGEKYDEHNTLQSFSPIYLSCMLDDYTTIEATISLSNRIALKINGRLYEPVQKNIEQN